MRAYVCVCVCVCVCPHGLVVDDLNGKHAVTAAEATRVCFPPPLPLSPRVLRQPATLVHDRTVREISTSHVS